MQRIEPTNLPAKLREAGLSVISYPANELPDTYLDQLIENSKQSHIAKHESGKSGRRSRFVDRDTFHRWASKYERIIYLLLTAERHSGGEEVGGVIWFGPKACPLDGAAYVTYDITFSIRLFESCLGQGLSVPFMQAAHADVLETCYPGHALWLETPTDNDVAQHAYTKFGYKVLGTYKERLVMGYSKGS